MPKFVTIGYGDRAGYDRTDPTIRDAAHRHDERLLAEGALMGIADQPVQVRNHDGAGVGTNEGPFMRSNLPIAGFASIRWTSGLRSRASSGQQPTAPLYRPEPATKIRRSRYKSRTRGTTNTRPHHRPVAQSTTTTTAIQTASSSRITSDDFRCRRSQFIVAVIPRSRPSLASQPLRRSFSALAADAALPPRRAGALQAMQSSQSLGWTQLAWTNTRRRVALSSGSCFRGKRARLATHSNQPPSGPAPSPSSTASTCCRT